MDKVIAFVKAHWPAILAFTGAAWMQFGTVVTAWIGAHPKYAGFAAFVSFTIAYYLKSPRQQKAS